jgi:hypothetical protein
MDNISPKDNSKLEKCQKSVIFIKAIMSKNLNFDE